MKKVIVFFCCAVLFMGWRIESENTLTREPVICSSADMKSSGVVIKNDLRYTSSTNEIVVNISTVPEAMSYDVTSFTVKAGQEITIHFTNLDSQQHNFILGKIGSLNKIGAAADALAMSPNGADMGYIPENENIISITPMLGEEEEFVIKLTVPNQPGDYPYLCTFPGHWRIMNGMMKVVAQ